MGNMTSSLQHLILENLWSGINTEFGVRTWGAGDIGDDVILYNSRLS